MFVLARIGYFLTLILYLQIFGFAKLQTSDSFDVVVYNVENLFDTDDVSLYDDYRKGMYGTKELENKLNSICEVLKKIGGKKGPDIILFQEIEVDRTPDNQPSATSELLRKLKFHGLGPYYHKLGYNLNGSTASWPAVHCLTLSKFPISDSRLHAIERARPILETTIEIGRQKFTLFNNHWKSGASSPEMERYRIQNAQVLRNRIDQLIEENPKIDFLVGGDLNSHYNQSTIHGKEMSETGINDRLLSSEIEPVREKIGRNLYNLWHELPIEERGSDAWKGEWGTLMHILLPESLYDSHGIRYVQDSFRVESHLGLNKIEGLGIPFEWSNDLNGFGASDHFPLSARFRITGPTTNKGNNFSTVESKQRPIDYDKAKNSATKWNVSELHPKNYGKTFSFNGKIENSNPLKIKIKDLLIGLYSFDSDTKSLLFSHSKGNSFSGFGYLSRYRGQWQFIIARSDWIN